MILDCHVHVGDAKPDPQRLISEMKQAKVDGAVLLSQPPGSFIHSKHAAANAAERIDNVLKWTAGENLFPAFWIDPTEDDAVEQVELARKRGVAAYKIICNHFYPGDERAMKTYHAIAATGKPLLFHSGILWDGGNSGKYNRPVEFEALIDVPKLRFSLAHISWPWFDECIAVYGKFQVAHRNRKDMSCEMFIDTTPGTPEIYRQEALGKVYTVGYDVADNVLFGTDCNTGKYDSKWASNWIVRDIDVLKSVNVDEAAREKYFYKNLQRFLGK